MSHKISILWHCLFLRMVSCILLGTFAFIACVLSLQSCSDKPSVQPTVPEIVFKQNPDVKMSDMFNEFTFIQLESNDDCIVPEVRKIIDVSDTLVVLSSTGEVYTFNRNSGKYIGEISAKGEGPEEYVEATDIVVNAKHNIGIIDRIKGNIKFFSLNGTFVEDKFINGNVGWMNMAELANDGKLLVCNQLTGGMPPQKYAYALVGLDTNESLALFDEFSPVTVGNYSTPFAEKPITAYGGELHFMKFLNDTLFSYKDGKIEPVCRMVTPKPFPSREVVRKQGDFDMAQMATISRNGNFFIGFNKIFETKNFLLLVPVISEQTGYYWVDKTKEKGYIFPGNPEVNSILRSVVEGKLIYNTVGSTDNEVIACLSNEIFMEELKSIVKEPNVKPFDSKMLNFAKKVNPEGNPCLIIYSHK